MVNAIVEYCMLNEIIFTKACRIVPDIVVVVNKLGKLYYLLDSSFTKSFT